MSKEKTPEQKSEREQRLEKVRLEILELLDGSSDSYEERVTYEWAMKGLLASGPRHLGLISDRIDELKTVGDSEMLGALHYNDSEEATALLVRALRNRTQNIRGTAAGILATRADDQIVAELKGRLLGEKRVDQRAALHFLMCLYDDRNAEPFMQAMDEETVQRLEVLAARRYPAISKSAQQSAETILRWWREEQAE